MRVLKANSSKWAREQRKAAGRFQWQGGYGAFTVSESQVDRLLAYIEQQEEHHRQMSFQEELVRLLEHHGIEFDRRYLWD
jgi:hypothetical protein